MKKNFFAVGSVVAAFALSLALITNPFSSKAAENSTAANVAALKYNPPGECTGPKESGECKSTNTAPCSDLSGCNSTVPVED
jgi:hypothetical protein